MLDIIILSSVQSVQRISFWGCQGHVLIIMQALHSYYMINERYVYNANESSQGYDHIKLAQLYYNLALTLAAAWHADKSFLDVPHSAA